MIKMYKSKNLKINKILQKLEEKEVDLLTKYIVNKLLQRLKTKSENPLII